MTIEKNVNLDLKEGICAEKKLLFNFVNCKNHFPCTLSYFLSSYFLQCTWTK
jgi:hypothetical protein